MSRSEIAGSYDPELSYDSSIFNFLSNPHTFSIVAAPTYLPTNSAQRSPSLPTFVISCFLDNRHYNRCEMISHCSFDLHSSDD